MAHLDSMLWLRKGEVSDVRLTRALNRLVVTPPPDFFTGAKNDPIENWVETRTHVGLPVAAGLKEFGDLDYEDRTTYGDREITVRSLPDPNHPAAAPGQARFMHEINEGLEDHFTLFAEAPTGSGKTVSVLNAIGTKKCPAIVVVPTGALATQWMDEAQKHLGMEPEQLGMVSGKRADWQGKDIVVAVLHNLFLKTYPDEFYRYFGFAAWDEAHRLGAQEFAKTMPLFHAAYKIAVSATPERKDGCESLVTNYFGPVRVRSIQQALPTTCYTMDFPHPFGVGWMDKCKSDSRPMKYLANHEQRNQLLGKIGLRAYDDGRNALFLTKFIDHIHLIAKALHAEGVPWDEIGQFCGKVMQEDGSVVKSTEAYLRHVKQSCPIVLATYQMMREGVDIPRLDVGVEALPTADGIQAIGRIRRPLPGKPEPLWFSIIDKRIGRFQGYARARLRGFEADGNITIRKLKETAI